MKANVSFEFDLSDPKQVELLRNISDYIHENGGAEPTVIVSETKKTMKVVPAPKQAAKVTEIKIDELRSIVREKSADKELRKKIVAKLAELGVKATSELQEEQFEEFKEFLDGI